LSSSQSECIFEDDCVLVRTIPLKHRVYTNGFLFEEKIGLRRIDADAAQAAGIDKSHYRLLQQGKDVESYHGTLVENKKVTFAPRPVMKYAYCSDTTYHPPIIDIIHKADWLYHEATFLNQHNALAAQTKHSTAQQAAEIAKKSRSGPLNFRSLLLKI
jgi:ribonuclease Z